MHRVFERVYADIDLADPELFELFLRSGVYLEYAQRHMQPALIDTIDIEDYLV